MIYQALIVTKYTTLVEVEAASPREAEEAIHQKRMEPVGDTEYRISHIVDLKPVNQDCVVE